jgi:rhodanese-related sulfurtransferase
VNILSKKGIKVINMEGGMNAWKDENLPSDDGCCSMI